MVKLTESSSYYKVCFNKKEPKQRRSSMDVYSPDDCNSHKNESIQSKHTCPVCELQYTTSSMIAMIVDFKYTASTKILKSA